jgi:hypothetical protein
MQRSIQGVRWFGERAGIVMLAWFLVIAVNVVDFVIRAPFQIHSSTGVPSAWVIYGSWIPEIPIQLVIMTIACCITVRRGSPWLAIWFALPALLFAAYNLVLIGHPSGTAQRIEFGAVVSSEISVLVTISFGIVLGTIWNRREQRLTGVHPAPP